MTRLSLAALMLLTACVPARFSGYRPVGTGALESSQCVAGLRDILRTQAREGVQLLWNAAIDPGDKHLLLNIVLEIPEGVGVRFLTPTVVLTSPAWPAPRFLTIRRITAAGPLEVGPMALLMGSSNRASSTFSLWYQVSGKGTLGETGLPAVERVTVKLPPLKINGERFQAGSVDFEASREWGFYTCAQ